MVTLGDPGLIRRLAPYEQSTAHICFSSSLAVNEDLVPRLRNGRSSFGETLHLSKRRILNGIFHVDVSVASNIARTIALPNNVTNTSYY